MEEIFENLARVPRFKDVPQERIAFEQLGGLTNRNYKVSLDGEAYVLRVAGEGTSEYIDREVEAYESLAAMEPASMFDHLYAVLPAAYRGQRSQVQEAIGDVDPSRRCNR